MNLQEAFELAQGRIPWNQMKSILKDSNILASIGWEKTYEKINDTYKKSELAELANTIYIAYKNNTLYGNKVLRLSKLPAKSATMFIEHVKKLKIPKTEFSEKFPKPVDSSSLKLASVRPVLTHINVEPKGVSLIYNSKRVYSERDEFDVDNLSNAAKKTFDQYDTVIALRTIAVQAYEVIHIGNDGYIEYRADYIDKIGLEDHAMFLGNLQIEFLKIANSLGISEDDIKVVNLYKLLEKFYAEEDGRIVEIGHDTGTGGGIVREKMRRKSMDVRGEKFHKAGMGATENISMFSIAKAWTIDDSDAEPELFFPGSIRTLSNKSLGTYEAVIKGCITKKHYEFVINKIKSLL